MKPIFLSRERRLVIGICLLLILISAGVYLWSHPTLLANFIKKPILETKKSIESSMDASSFLSEKWVSYDKTYSPIGFSRPESWGKVNINMWWADPYTQGTRHEYYFKDESENNRKAHSTGWRQSIPIALRVETNDSVYRGSKDDTMISATNVDLRKTDWEIKQAIALPWTQTLTIKRVTVSGKDGLYVEEAGQSSRTYSYRRIYYLFPKFNDAADLNLTIAMQPEMKGVLDRFAQSIVFKSGFKGSFLQLDPYVFEDSPIDTSDWHAVTNTELGISYKLPSGWEVNACSRQYAYNRTPSGCRYGRSGVLLGPKKEMRAEGEDYSFSFGFVQESENLDRVAMESLEDLDKVDRQGSIALYLESVHQLHAGPFAGVLQVRGNKDVDLRSYEYRFRMDDYYSFVLTGTEGTLDGFPPHGTFKTILDSIQSIDMQSIPISYKHDALGFSFEYPRKWGHLDLNTTVFGMNNTSGIRHVIRFSPRQPMSTPEISIESNDYSFDDPDDARRLSARKVDLTKTNTEIVEELSFPWTTSMKVTRRKLSHSDGLVVEEKGVDPLDGTDYHVLYYLFPKYDQYRFLNLAIRVDFSDRQEIEYWLNTFDLQEKSDGKERRSE